VKFQKISTKLSPIFAESSPIFDEFSPILANFRRFRVKVTNFVNNLEKDIEFL
jgi:hypothetical protein